MSCKTPQAITYTYNEGPHRAHYVKCGRCSGCLKSRASEWMIRLYHELENSQYGGTFVTLTYADHMLPTDTYDNPVLVKRHLQNYFKRLRKNLNQKIKYYAIGEYGGNTKRPHYHYIAFNLNHNVEGHWKAIRDSWHSYDPTIEEKLPIGHVYVRDVNCAAIAYVTGYVIKPDQHLYADELGIQREFACQSNGLGLAYLTLQMKKHIRRKAINYVIMPNSNGKKRSLPRYYREKLFNLKTPFEIEVNGKKSTANIFNLEEVYAYADWK